MNTQDRSTASCSKVYFRFGQIKHLYELKELFHMGKSCNSERQLCPTENITSFI